MKDLMTWWRRLERMDENANFLRPFWLCSLDTLTLQFKLLPYFTHEMYRELFEWDEQNYIFVQAICDRNKQLIRVRNTMWLVLGNGWFDLLRFYWNSTGPTPPVEIIYRKDRFLEKCAAEKECSIVKFTYTPTKDYPMWTGTLIHENARRQRQRD